MMVLPGELFPDTVVLELLTIDSFSGLSTVRLLEFRFSGSSVGSKGTILSVAEIGVGVIPGRLSVFLVVFMAK